MARPRIRDRAAVSEALAFHSAGKPGKLEIRATKPLTTARELTLAYSPGVAEPCLEIEKEPARAYDYTAKGNIVAVVSNGSAVLGLGNLGALAAKPVMEGKAVLFKRFADIDGIDLEVDTGDVDEFVDCVRFLGKSWGGINLEDIRAPECFIIEQRLREAMDIPVFHDDQHGTAIIAAAGLVNALHLTDRKLIDTRVVVNGAGAAGIACAELLKSMGVPGANIILCDTRGVIYRGREAGMNQWKSGHTADTKLRTLAAALKGADVFYGLSAKGAMTADMVKSMAPNPIIFAMANPDPEITPEEVQAIRDDAIMATGRSDYPNQLNNVLGFPYIFRGALDMRASTINEEMKIAAAEALAALAREDVPDEVAAAYSAPSLRYGPDYILPKPFDPRLIVSVPAAVARAAIDSGVAGKRFKSEATYRHQLRARLDPTASSMQMILDEVRDNPTRMLFAEGEEEKVIRAALQWLSLGLGTPVLIGRERKVHEALAGMGQSLPDGLEIHNASLGGHNKLYTDFLYDRLHRQGYLYRDCQRLVNQDRNVFAACMVAAGHGQALITGLTRSYYMALEDISRVLDPRAGERLFGLSVMIARGTTVFIADSTVHELPTPEELADIACQSAAKAREMGHEPRVAVLSFSNFGDPRRDMAVRIRDVVAVLDSRNVDFEYDGEIAADVALKPELLALYPFCRLSGPANVLIMPNLHSANISTKLLQELGGGIVVGPLLMGLEKPAQIVPMGANVSAMVNLAAFAAHEAIRRATPTPIRTARKAGRRKSA
ncbi:MAG: NADP-dependent malic enzyme [Alphaproteobacteria bacterium]|jgi:malate dehydrogenase (oxaloacetate-decarboxylating)(NADP+)|nr:NADP-dependent malic enzyme [Alphaproteobacteria bacterium]MDP6516988.1 NADP-dependent malic enzyme [Alphaproteobacteria bacterium]